MNYFLNFKGQLKHKYHRLRSYLGRPKVVLQTQPVMLSEYNSCENPIFLIGVHRSGTSLCRRIINSHSQIACPPETFFLKHFASMIQDKHTMSGFEGMGFETTKVINEIKIWSSQYHEAYRIMNGKSRWADKTPQYIDILSEINKIFGSQTQYIMIFRNPLDVVYSLFTRRWSLSYYNADPLINTALYVSKSIQKQLSFIENHPQQCFSLFYENLICDPEHTLKKTFDFLGEPWEKSVLNYHKFEHGFGTEDPIVRGASGFVENFDNWKAFNQAQISCILPLLQETMIKLNYYKE